MNIVNRLSRIFMLLAVVLIMLGDMSVYAAAKRTSSGSRASSSSSNRSLARSRSSSGVSRSSNRSSSRSAGRVQRSRAARKARPSRSSGARTRSSSRSRSQARSGSRTKSRASARRSGSRKSGRKTGRKAVGRKSGRKAGRKAGRKSGRKSAGRRKSGKKSGRKAGRKSGKRAARKAGKRGGKRAGKRAGGRRTASRSTRSSAARTTNVRNSLAASRTSAGVGAASSVAAGVALAADARVGLATSALGVPIGVSLGIGTGYLRGGGYFGGGCGTGWSFRGGYWGGLGCSWYPGIGFFGLSSWGCYYNPFLSACLFPWSAALIATGLWPAWVFPGFGCTLYAAATYPGCILSVEPEYVSSTWCGVYYRDPETGMLVRYIRPRVIVSERVKINVPVREDGYERIVVISRNSNALAGELPENPEDVDGLKYIALNDPKGVKPADAPDEAEFEDLTPEELDIIARTNAKIDETAGKDKLKKLEELKGLDLEKADLEKQEK